MLAEGLLDRVQSAHLRGHPLDCGDLGPMRLNGEYGAGLHGFPVDKDRARPARRGVAADVGPPQSTTSRR